MAQFELSDHPHRRFNPLTGEWLLVSPHRAKRPWKGQLEKKPEQERPAYDPTCYLCPGNTRANGEINPRYTTTYVFDNDFAALLPDTPEGEWTAGDLLMARAERGCCRVICFSPCHDLSLAEMTTTELRQVVDVWAEEYARLAAHPDIGYVQIFENKGLMMGCSNPHPHGQVWATETVPGEPAKELAQQRAYRERNGKCLLCTYLELELTLRERIICENDHFVALVPFWAVWPFETLVLPRRHCGALPALCDPERDALADLFRLVTVRYDNLFETSFPYSMGWHQAPTDGEQHEGWHLHAHFFPPLLRSAEVKKYMVGFEMLGNPQRDITAESAAERLRALPETHYRQGE